MKSVRAIVHNIESKAFAEGVDALSDEERLLFVAWQETANIGNGGFHRFYQGGGDIDELAAAYKELGLRECAEACAKSKAVFPKGHPFADREATAKFLKARWEEIDDAFSKIEKPIYGLGLEFEGLIEPTSEFLARRRRARR
jgi:hypothetical protein